MNIKCFVNTNQVHYLPKLKPATGSDPRYRYKHRHGLNMRTSIIFFFYDTESLDDIILGRLSIRTSEFLAYLVDYLRLQYKLRSDILLMQDYFVDSVSVSSIL